MKKCSISLAQKYKPKLHCELNVAVYLSDKTEVGVMKSESGQCKSKRTYLKNKLKRN
jgi:hypothetical protein